MDLMVELMPGSPASTITSHLYSQSSSTRTSLSTTATTASQDSKTSHIFTADVETELVLKCISSTPKFALIPPSPALGYQEMFDTAEGLQLPQNHDLPAVVPEFWEDKMPVSIPVSHVSQVSLFLTDSDLRSKRNKVRILAAAYFHSHPGHDGWSSNIKLHFQCSELLLSQQYGTPDDVLDMEQELILRLTNQNLANLYRRYIEDVTGHSVASELGLGTCEEYQMTSWRCEREGCFDVGKVMQRWEDERAWSQMEYDLLHTSGWIKKKLLPIVNPIRLTARANNVIRSKSKKEYGRLSGYKTLDRQLRLKDEWLPTPKRKATQPGKERYSNPILESPYDVRYQIMRSERKNRVAKLHPSCFDSLFETSAFAENGKQWEKPSDYLSTYLCESSFSVVQAGYIAQALASKKEEFLAIAKERTKNRNFTRSGFTDAQLIDSAAAVKRAHECKWRDPAWMAARAEIWNVNSPLDMEMYQWSRWNTSSEQEALALRDELMVFEKERKMSLEGVEKRRVKKLGASLAKKMKDKLKGTLDGVEIPAAWILVGLAVTWK